MRQSLQLYNLPQPKKQKPMPRWMLILLIILGVVFVLYIGIAVVVFFLITGCLSIAVVGGK